MDQSDINNLADDLLDEFDDNNQDDTGLQEIIMEADKVELVRLMLRENMCDAETVVQALDERMGSYVRKFKEAERARKQSERIASALLDNMVKASDVLKAGRDTAALNINNETLVKLCDDAMAALSTGVAKGLLKGENDKRLAQVAVHNA